MTESGPTAEPGTLYCTQCGVPLPAQARFCPGCGRATTNALEAGDGAARSSARSPREQLPGLAVLTLFLAVGLAIWLVVLRPGAPTSRAPSRSPAATGAGNMPPGHPPIELPEESKKTLESLAAKAEAAPDDAAAWRNLARGQARAAGIDPTYGPRAVESYRRLLGLAPDDADAVRDLGNVLYDQRQFAAAAEQYESYLKTKPDDASVRTDLATSYLYQRQVDRAIDTYNSVIEANPDFLQAHFNIALAYEAKGERAKALDSLAKARTLAPTDAARSQIDRVTEQLKSNAAGGGVQGGVGQPSQPPGGGEPGARDEAKAELAASVENLDEATSKFRNEVEAALRAHQVIGPKITAIDWPQHLGARVRVSSFPIQEMPEFARDLLRGRLEAILGDAKTKSGVSGESAIEIVDAGSGASVERVTQ